MIEITKPCILILVYMILTFIQGHSCMRDFGVPFLANLNSNLDEIQYWATVCWFAGHGQFILHK